MMTMGSLIWAARYLVLSHLKDPSPTPYTYVQSLRIRSGSGKLLVWKDVSGARMCKVGLYYIDRPNFKKNVHLLFEMTKPKWYNQDTFSLLQLPPKCFCNFI